MVHNFGHTCLMFGDKERRGIDKVVFMSFHVDKKNPKKPKKPNPLTEHVVVVDVVEHT